MTEKKINKFTIQTPQDVINASGYGLTRETSDLAEIKHQTEHMGIKTMTIKRDCIPDKDGLLTTHVRWNNAKYKR